MVGLFLWKNECLQVRFEGVQRRVLSERKGKAIMCVCVLGGGGGVFYVFA